MPKALRPFLLCSMILVVAGCATERVSVRVMRPAPVDLGQADVVAVDRFSGENCEHLGDVLAEALRRTPNPMTGRVDYEVVDRGQLDHMLDDMRHRRGGELDAETKALLSRWQNADLLISGDVPVNHVDEEMVEVPFVDGEGLPHIKFVRKCTANVSIVITVSDGTGHQVIDRVQYNEVATATSSAIDAVPAPVDYASLAARAQQRVVHRYLRRVMPHEDYVSVQLFTDGDLPELKVGNGFARTGSWEDALESYREGLSRARGDLGDVRYKALFNMGVALEYTNRFDEARKAFKEAYALEQDRRILQELQNLSYREEEYARLLQQGRAATGNMP